MAHFALVDNDYLVTNIIVIPDEHESTGPEYIATRLGLTGRWIQCSYNGSIRKQYPGVGFSYDPINDIFIEPQPYPSWSLDANFCWQPPISKPDTERSYYWDERNYQWRDMFIPEHKVTPVVILGDE